MQCVEIHKLDFFATTRVNKRYKNIYSCVLCKCKILEL